MSPLRALFPLTRSLIVRMLREPVVLRSLIFPPVLIYSTLIFVICVFSYLRGVHSIALGPSLSEHTQLIQTIENEGIRVLRHDDPALAVKQGLTSSGATQEGMWFTLHGPKTVEIERLVRTELGSSWVPEPAYVSGLSKGGQDAGQNNIVVLNILFGLYGIVFGAASVVRDRDSGSLLAELTLPLPRWVHGAARLFAGTFVLSFFFLFSIALLNTLMPVTHPERLFAHGLASQLSATALGLLCASVLGPKVRFTAPLSWGISLGTLAIFTGYRVPALRPWLPPLSTLSDSSGLGALLMASVLGAFAVLCFDRRVQI